MKKGFTEVQIIGVLKDADAGEKVAALCRKCGISDAAYYNQNLDHLCDLVVSQI